VKLTFRWYGEKDCIPLEYIKQIQGMTGVVTAHNKWFYRRKSCSFRDVPRIQAFFRQTKRLFRKLSPKETEMPFEQYMLMSLIEPRTLSIGSAIEDLWANPPAEFYSAAKASEIYPRTSKNQR